jgi:hypothetical protein
LEDEDVILPARDVSLACVYTEATAHRGAILVLALSDKTDTLYSGGEDTVIKVWCVAYKFV